MSRGSGRDTLRSYVRMTQFVLAAQILASVVAAVATGYMLLQLQPLIAERERLTIEVDDAAAALKTADAAVAAARQAGEELRSLVLDQRARVVAAQRASAETVEEAIRSFHKDNFAAAVRTYRRALQVDPRNPYILNLKSYAEFKSGELDTAVETAQRALTIDPTYVWGYFDLMRYQCAAGDHIAAMKTFDDALADATNGPIDPLFPKNRPSDLLNGLKFFLIEANDGEGDGEFRRHCQPILPRLTLRLNATGG